MPGETISPRADIQAVLEVLRRRTTSRENDGELRINLSRAFLKGADLTWMRLRGASLIEADLRDSYLQDSDLRGAKLERAKLGGARLARARLDNADLRGASLERTHLQQTSLACSDLRGAVLRGANLWRARLAGADLSAADLREANLRETDLSGASGLTESQLWEALSDPSTRLPAGLARERKPAIVEEAPRTEGFLFRPGTMDEAIFQTVVRHNEYHLPGSLDGADVVIDLGAHIGSFTYACLLRGAGRVYAVEAAEENVAVLRRNLAPFGDRVEAMHCAAWRSDLLQETRLNYPDFPTFAGLLNTGGAGVAFGRGNHQVRALPFDRILQLASNEGQRRIRLLKLDVEGSEWPILLTSRSLQAVDALCGEFHEFGGTLDFHTAPFAIPGYSRFTIVELERFLAGLGFRVRHVRHLNQDGGPSHMGLFWANRAA